jgi:hypothetical protein
MRHPLLLSVPVLITVVIALPPVTGAAPENPPAAPAAGAEVVGPPKVAWKDMTGEQRARYMKAVVTPKMRKVFQDFDAEHFKKVDCATCHGKNAKDRKFKMPNPDIAPLPPTPERYKAALEKKPSWGKWSKFMGETVEPQVAALIGKPVFNPAKPDPAAFGCIGCHTLEK